MYVPTGRDLSEFHPHARMVAHSLIQRCASGSLALIFYISTEALEAAEERLAWSSRILDTYALQLEQNI